MRMSFVHPTAIAALLALTLAAGCSNAPPPQGSWIEIRRLEESPNAVDVEGLPAFRSVTVMPDRLVFVFDGASPLAVGNVVAGRHMGGYQRRITALGVLPDGSVEAMTALATLDEYYTDIAFVFHYQPVRVPAGGVPQVPGVVTSPLTTVSCEDTTPCEVTGGHSWGDGTAGCTLSYGAGMYLGPFLTTDLDGTTFEFDPDLPWFSRPTAYFHLQGEVRAGVRVSGSAAASLTCTADFAALLGAPEITLACVSVGPVPVCMTATPILNGEIGASIDAGEFTAEAGVQATVTAEFGFDHGAAIDPPRRTFGFEPFAEATTARAGAFSAHASLTAGVDIRLVVGVPELVSAWGGAAITGTLGVEWTAPAQGCEWTASFPWSADVQLEAGAQIGHAPLEWSDSWSGPSFNVASGSLGSLGGRFPLCTAVTPSACTGTPCLDALYATQICDGMSGFQGCAGGTYQLCTCTAGSWTSCGACM